MMQIRTKSHYPYLFNTDVSTAILHAASIPGTPSASGDRTGVSGIEDRTIGVPGTNVHMRLEHLADDVNCTFTNSDHMREGDICTQEWLLHRTPEDNVCYATGEYSIEFTADCFYGKDVCYLPVDENLNDITTVTFTFKVQTSKFCPELADTVDLSGHLEVMGRESFKPAEEGVELATAGQMYMQGETIHVLATTKSDKARIERTEVIMVELVQSFDALVRTGYNRVPFDESFADKTVWMRNRATDLAVRVADGTLTVTTDTETTTGVVLMEDAGVFKTGDNPCANHAVFHDCTFDEFEAGFLFNLHSRAMPVNVDSFGTKTLEATYEALSNANELGRRRRLLQNSPTFDMRSSASFGTVAWRPASMPKGLGSSASMALEITLSSSVDRTNALSFSQAIHSAIVQSLNSDGNAHTAYDSQVSVDQIFSNGASIWTRPQQGQIASRRLLNVAQKLRIEFTFAKSDEANSMSLGDMLAIFDKQLRSPASPLLTQPVLSGAVVHKVEEVSTSDYQAPTQTQLASSSMVALPSLFA